MSHADSELNKSKRAHSIRAILRWIVCCVAVGLLGAILGIKTSLPGPSSPSAINAIAGERAAAEAGVPVHESILFVVRHPSLLTDQPAFISARDELVKLLSSIIIAPEQGPLFTAVRTVGHTWFSDELYQSEDLSALLVTADSNVSPALAGERLRDLPEALAPWRARFPEFELHLLSNAIGDNEMFDLIDSDLDHSLIVTLPLTFLVLIISFGSMVAALIPLAVASISLGASLGFAAIISEISGPVSATAAQLVVLLVLAIGIDYSLFFVSRLREEVASGCSTHAAVQKAIKQVSPAVFWSGFTVALSLAGLLLMKDTILRSMGLVALASVIITLVGVLYVMPPLLSLWGERLTCSRFEFLRHSATQRTLIRASIDRPWLVLTCSVLLLVALSSLCLKLSLGSTVEPSFFPRSMQSSKAYNALMENFPDSSGPDFTVILFAEDLSQKEDEGALQDFLDHLNSLPGVKGPFAVDRSDDGKVIRTHYNASKSANDQESRALVDEILHNLGPKFLDRVGVSYSLGGTLPFATNEAKHYAKYFPRVFAGVLALSFLFLLLAFRSIVIPIKAVLLNLLSTGAAFGTLVIVFQSEYSPWNYGVVESFVPALLFTILFGLSMDYHVFILSRIREENDLGRTPAESVEVGIMATARTITSAAAIMIVVFATIASLQLPVMKQLGTGLAVAVLLDATIIRSMLLPASMVLLGKWNWYLPKWLEWIPRIKFH